MLSLLLATVLVIGIAEGARADTEPISFLAVVEAGGGAWQGGAGKLVLTDVARRATWFTDRPVRKAGSYELPQLLGVFFDGSVSPNAALEFEGKNGKRSVVVVELSTPRYKHAARRLVFDAVILDDPVSDLRADTALVDFVERRAGKIPSSFGAATLFIDSATSTTSGASENAKPTSVGTGNDARFGSFTFSGSLSSSKTVAYIDVDCRKEPVPHVVNPDGSQATYEFVARDPSTTQDIFDRPRLEADVGGGASWDKLATASVTNAVGSRLATAIRVVVALNQAQNDVSYSFTVWCADQRNDAWEIFG